MYSWGCWDLCDCWERVRGPPGEATGLLPQLPGTELLGRGAPSLLAHPSATLTASGCPMPMRASGQAARPREIRARVQWGHQPGLCWEELGCLAGNVHVGPLPAACPVLLADRVSKATGVNSR